MILGTSIVIVNFNAGPGLVACVRRALSAAEVILVDNASSDDSIAHVVEAFPQEPKLRILRNDQNLGFSKACNQGARAAFGELLLFLNPDCEMEGDALPVLEAELRGRPRVGMAGGVLVNPDGTEQAGGRRSVPTPMKSLVRLLGLGPLVRRWRKDFSQYDLNAEPLPTAPVEVEAISGACMMVKRAAIEEVGLLDELYFMHCEDLDWCMRFRQKGWSILFVPEAKLVHHKGVCSKSRPIFVELHKHRGMLRFYRKFFSSEYPTLLMWAVTASVWLRFGALVVTHMLRRARAGWLSTESD
jgi:GT2 family glycosyltransferase